MVVSCGFMCPEINSNAPKACGQDLMCPQDKEYVVGPKCDINREISHLKSIQLNYIYSSD